MSDESKDIEERRLLARAKLKVLFPALGMLRNGVAIEHVGMKWLLEVHRNDKELALLPFFLCGQGESRIDKTRAQRPSPQHRVQRSLRQTVTHVLC